MAEVDSMMALHVVGEQSSTSYRFCKGALQGNRQGSVLSVTRRLIPLRFYQGLFPSALWKSFGSIHIYRSVYEKLKVDIKEVIPEKRSSRKCLSTFFRVVEKTWIDASNPDPVDSQEEQLAC